MLASRPASVALREILDERDLQYRDPLELWPGAEALRASVRRCGVLEPVQLQETGAGLVAVSGFRRLQLGRELSLDGVPAWIADRGEDRFALFCRAVEAHAAQPSSLRERLRALEVADRLAAPAERIVRELLPPLGLAAEAHLLEDLRRLQALPAGLRDLLAQKGFSLRRCLPFSRLDRGEGERLAGLCRRLGLGGRQIEDLLLSLLEVCARDGLSPGRLLDELGALPGAEPALAALFARRYPETARRTRALEEAGRRLRAAAGAELHWDPSLAGESLELLLKLGSAAELAQRARALGGEDAREALEAAFQEL
jgi:hypothetical protein